MPFALFSSRKTAVHRSHSHHSLRRAAGLGLGLLSLLSFSAGHSAQAGTVNWDNTPGDWFANPSHWSNGSTPASGDDAINNSAAAMTLGQSTTIQSFFSNGAFTLTGGTLTGNQPNSAGTLTVNNVFTLNGGQINNFTVNQGTGGSVIVAANGSNSINNSIVNADLDMTTAYNAYLDLYGSVTENGSINIGTTANGIRLVYSGANLTLGSAGSLTGFGTVSQVQDTTLASNGVVNANSAGNTLAINTTSFNNTGTAEATKGGTLSLNNSTANNGNITADGTGSVVSLSGTVTNSVGSLFTASNGGQLQVNGANLLGTINGTTGTSLIIAANAGNTINNGGTGATVNTNLDLTKSTNAYLDLYGSVTENGSINIGTTANGIRLVYSGANLTLGSAGSLTGFGTVSQVQDTTLASNGVVNANSAGNTLAITTTNFVNTGTAEATQGGVLSLSNSTTNNGTIAAKSGGIVDISGTLTGSTASTLDGAAGTININGANLLGTINGTAGTSLIIAANAGNTINNGGTGATVNTNLDLTKSTNAYLDLYGSVTENGSINIGTTANGIRLVYSGANLTLGSAGSLTGFGTVSQVQDTTFASNGVVNANSAGNTLAITTTNFVNTGTAEATQGGVLSLSNSTANNGTIAAKSGGIVDISGTLTGSAASTLDGAAGTININGANLLGTINGTTGTSLIIAANAGNTINYNTPSGTVATVNANLDLTTAPTAYLDLYGSVTENGSINIGTTANGIRLVYSGANLTLGSAGSLTGFGTVSQVQDTTLANNGVINANSSGNTLTLNTTVFNNNGTAEATNGATLALNNTNTNANDGSTLAAKGPGSIIAITGTLTGTGSNLMTASNGGQVQMNGATFLGTINTDPSTAIVVAANAGNQINGSAAPATINGNLDMTKSTNAYLDLYGSVTENGSISIGTTANGIRLVYSGANLTLGSAGSLTGFGTVSQVQDTTLASNGVVNANSAGNTLVINTTSFNNTGTAEVQSGAALSVTSATTDSGNILVANGGTATFSQGVIQTAGVTQADGTLNSPLTLTGGTLKGTGTVNGNVVNNGGTVAAGDSPGTLAVTGNYTQASGGTLNAQFTNSAASLLTVSGLVTLDGTLDANYLGSAAYTGTGPFTFLSYGTLATTGTNALGLTQYFANETALTNDTGLITGHDGFTYMLFNNTAADVLQLEVQTAGAPAPVPEASSVISFGALLALGGAGLWSAKRRRSAPAR